MQKRDSTTFKKLMACFALTALLLPSFASAQTDSRVDAQEIVFDNLPQIRIVNLDAGLVLTQVNLPVSDDFGVECSSPSFQITFNFLNLNNGLSDGGGNFIQYSYQYNGIETIEGSVFPGQLCVPINSNIDNWRGTVQVNALDVIGKPSGVYTDRVTVTVVTE